MPRHVALPNTIKKRDRQIRRMGTEYSEWLKRLEKDHHLDAKNLMRRVRIGLRRITLFKGLSPGEIVRRKALFINRQAGYITDARIGSEEIGLEKYNAMHPKTKSDLWSKIFSDTINSLIKHIVKDPQVAKAIEQIDLYLALPENIHRRRGSGDGWKRMKRIRNKVIESGGDPKENLLKQIDKILSRRKSGENYKVKAMDVCVAASIYTDVLRKQKKVLWTRTYREAMEIVYPKVSTDEKLLNAIIELSKTNPQKD